MLPVEYSLEDAARVVWEAATKGRWNARAGYRSAATAFMEGLRGVQQTRYPASLRIIAHSAAEDINKMLNGEPLDSEGSVA